MKKATKVTLTILRRTIGYGLLGVVVSMVSIAVYLLNHRANLGIWQEVILDGEFQEGSDVKDFTEYLALEDKLFAEMEEKIYAKTPPGNAKTINRYQKGSMMDPTSMPVNWNRSFEMTQADPKAGVLLIHGLSDSPYSMRELAERFHTAGASVIGMRVPGHGTAPSGLVEVKWQDMAAAVPLAAKHLKASIGDKPLYLVGYSNGGALSVLYTLQSLEDKSLPRPDGLVLLSPEIGVSKAAALAVWQARIGHWLGLEKLAWNSISVEYDPYKYCSFAVNAGDLAYRITDEIEEKLAQMSEDKELADFPRTIAFQSAADATVSAPDLVTRLFDRLPEKGHELVLFDINRDEVFGHLVAKDPATELKKLLIGPNHLFSLSVLTNAVEDGNNSSAIVINHRKSGKEGWTTEPTQLQWPPGIFSLSHVALPFSASDPFYGNGDGGETLTLGNLALRGERGFLLITPGEMLRQRWNPFFPWLESKAVAFTGLGASDASESD